MMQLMTGQGSRDDAATVQDFVKQFGFDSTADRILPVPSGVVWAAWEKFVQVEPWENLESNPRTAPTARIRLVTYNNWFAVPHGTQRKATLRVCPTTLSILVGSLFLKLSS